MLKEKKKGMNALREKFTEKLSRIFSDSSSSSSSPANSSPHPLPDDSDHAQTMSNAKEGKSFTSYLSFIMPMGRSDSSRSRDDEPDVGLYHSLHVKRTDENPEWQYLSLDRHVDCMSGRRCCENSMVSGESNEWDKFRKDGQPLCDNVENEDPGSGRSTSGSEIFEEATDLCSPKKPLDNLLDKSTFISPTLYEFLHASLPNIVKGCQWALLYSTLKHGISLRTLIRKSADLSGPCLLIVGDNQGAVFGGMLQSPLRPTAKRKYQGSNQTFVFTTLYGQPRLFRATGANRYYYMCLNDLLALGGGGDFALRLDEDLLSGTSGTCETFGNSCLAHNMDFELKNVEDGLVVEARGRWYGNPRLKLLSLWATGYLVDLVEPMGFHSFFELYYSRLKRIGACAWLLLFICITAAVVFFLLSAYIHGKASLIKLM